MSKQAKFEVNLPMKKNYTDSASAARAKARVKKMRERERANAVDMIYRVGGEPMNRLQVMEFITAMVYEGYDVPRLIEECKDEEFPTAAEIYRWKSIHTGFADVLAQAEQFAADKLASDGLHYVLQLKDQDAGRDEIAKAKLINEVSVQHAAFLADKFQSKSKVQTEELKPKYTEEEAKARIAQILKNRPELANQAPQPTAPTEEAVIESDQIESVCSENDGCTEEDGRSECF